MTYFFLLFVALSYILDAASALAVVRTTTSKLSEPTIVQRDEKIVTITMGDMGQYENYDGNDKVDKRSVAIFPTGFVTQIPETGIHVAIGPDMQKDLDVTARENCKDPSNMQKCVEEIHKTLSDSSLSQHTKRFILISAFTVAAILELLVDVAVAAIAAAAIDAGVNAAIAPESVNFEDTGENGVLAQIETLVDVSAIAIATGTANDIMATITVPSTPTPSQKPEEAIKIEEVLKDDGDNKKGDILIQVPEDTANRLKDYLTVMGLDKVKEVCKAKQRLKKDRSTHPKRTPPTLDLNEECEEGLEQLVGYTLAAEDNGMLQLVPANPNNPMNPANNPQGAAVPDIRVDGAVIAADLARQRFGNANPNVNRLNEFIMRAAIATLIVQELIEETMRLANGIMFFRMLFDSIIRLFTKDVVCKSELICLEDDCKGYKDIGPSVPLFQGRTRHQTGRCTTADSRGCLCEVVTEPWIYQVEGQDYFDELAQYITELDKDVPTPNCDSNNKIDVDPKRFKDSVDSACNNHDELRRLKKRGGNGWDWEKVDGADGNSLQWSFDWNDKGDKCEMNCEDVFQIFQEDDNCIWDVGMSRDGYVQTDCGIASYSVDRPDPATCWTWPYGAPRGQAEVDHEGVPGTSVEEALEQFCDDIDGQKVEATDDETKNQHSRRWGFAEWGVPDRRSFWLKAQYAPRSGCQGYEWPHKTNCKAALKQGMDTCSSGQGRTGGLLIEGIGCIDYSIHLTDNVFDDSPPWKDPVLRFPPPLDAPKKGGGTNDVICSNGQPTRPLADDDLNKAIDAFCQDGKDIVGFGDSRNRWSKMFDYPPKGQPQFYQGAKNTMHLTMGAETVNNGAPQPYDNMDQCKNYDFKMGKDDCPYALRKIHHTCTNSNGELMGGDFTYRCVHYKSWGVNA